MKKSLFLVLVFSLLSSMILPNTVGQVNAATYNENFPAYSLYTKESIIEKEVASYDISTFDNYKVEESLTYTLFSEPNSTHEFYIPFSSHVYEIPNIEVKINDIIVNTELLYGDSWHLYRSDKSIENAISKAYKPIIDENLSGTLYTITANSSELTITYKKNAGQTLIYDCGNSYRATQNDGCITYSTNATQGQEYKIFVVGGDLELFETENSYTTTTITCKQYVDDNYLAWEDFYNECNVDKGYLYSEISRIISNKATIRSDELFTSFDKYRMNFFKFSAEFSQAINIITYSQKVRVQCNTIFEPDIYMFEREKTANYVSEYNIKMTENFPYVVESNIQLNKDGDTYKASSQSDSFYCVYSTGRTPKNEFGNVQKDENNPWLIVIISSSVLLIGLLSYTIITILRERKNKGK